MKVSKFTMMKVVYGSRSYSGDYDEGCRFTVADVILETMMKVTDSL